MRFQEILSVAASCLSISSVKQHETLDDSQLEVDLGYERYRAIVNDTNSFYDFSNIRYGQDAGGTGRWMPPREPEEVDNPPLGSGEERICIQATAAWFPKAGGFIQNWFDPKVQINETDWIKPPNATTSWPPLGNQSTAASEDCLFLDVKVPFKVWEKKKDRDFVPAPVMIWIHGGGYAFGWKHQAGNPVGMFKQASTGDGTEYEDGVIYVAMNYRLGAFGWLSGSGILKGTGSTNLGWLDQTLAMKWVQEYIEEFGGDPEMVTVFGESAGASSILHHITAYGGRGPNPPFKRAILQSPAFFPQPEPTQQEAAYETLMREAGVENFAGLRNLSTSELTIANGRTIQKSNYGQFTFGPTSDYFINSVLPGQALLGGHFFQGIDIMTAYNKREGLLFTPPYVQTDSSFHEYLQKTFPASEPDVIDEIEELYPVASYEDSDRGGEAKVRIDRLAEALGDAAVNCNTYYLQKALRRFSRTSGYAYFFAVVPPIHGFDVPYTYYPENPPDPPIRVDAAKAVLLQRYLVNFAKTGDPNKPPRTSSNLPVFPRYGAQKEVMEFSSTAWTGKSNDGLNTSLCDWWQMAYYY